MIYNDCCTYFALQHVNKDVNDLFVITCLYVTVWIAKWPTVVRIDPKFCPSTFFQSNAVKCIQFQLVMDRVDICY